MASSHEAGAAPFGRYLLRERLAQGGMGEVFRAVAVGEHGFEKPVVIKRVLPAHAGREDLAELFIAEAKLMTRLAHPNIVEVYDFGRGEHRDCYLVLELVVGLDLSRLLRAQAARGAPLPVPLALFIAAQVLRGLHHAHTRLADEGVTIVHRDVSPSNVLLSTEGEVKVADFGVALVQQGSGDGGGVAGKLGYMAPEQFDGRPVDPRADVFSVGVVLHQMLTSVLPFAGDTPADKQEAARRGDHARASASRADVSEALDAILDRALSPRAVDRFASARAMAQAIEALGERGERLASPDDLADVVRLARAELPAPGRRVIALGSAAPDREAEPDPEAPRELTRHGGGAFTLRLPVRADATTRQEPAGEAIEGRPPTDRYSAPEPRTERIDLDADLAPPLAPAPEPAPSPDPAMESRAPDPVMDSRAPDPVMDSRDPASEPRSPRRAIPVAVLGAAALIAVALAAWVASIAMRPRVAPPVAITSSAPPPVVSSAPTADPAPTAAPVPTVSVAPAVTPRPVAPLRPSLPTASAAPTVTAAAAVDPDCTGTVRFSSEDSWSITGGPAPAQTPAVVVWRCGTYTLTARYRPDPTRTRQVTVNVRPDRAAQVRLDVTPR